jgi:hypothetical protein
MSKRRTGTPPDERAHALAPECRAPEAPAQWSLIVSAVPSGSAGEPTPTTDAHDVEDAARFAWLEHMGCHLLYTELDPRTDAVWTVVNQCGPHRHILGVGATAREALTCAMTGGMDG